MLLKDCHLQQQDKSFRGFHAVNALHSSLLYEVLELRGDSHS